jgi:DNA-binding beta-propeller fold protein YncE
MAHAPSVADLLRGLPRRERVNRRRFLALAAAAPFAVREAAAAAASAPLALVTCDAESRLALVDLGSLGVVGSVATPPDPRAIEQVGGLAVVCHTAAGAVSIVDRRRVLHVLHGFEEPRYVAAHPDGRHAFVTDSGSSSVTALDVVSGRLLGRARLGGWARHVSLDAAGRRLWVGLGSAAADVAVVDVADPVRPRRVATVATPFLSHDVGFAPDGSVWVTSGEHGETAIFDARGRLRSRHRADAAPQHVTFAKSVGYVTSGDDGTFKVQSLGGRVLRASAIPRGSYNVQHGRGLVLTPSLDRGTLAVLDLSGRLRRVIEVAGSCHDACFIT